MDTRKLAAGFASLALLTGIGAWAIAQPAGQPPAKAPEKADKEGDEQVIDFAKAPEAVRAAALKLVGAGGEKAIKKVIKEEEEDVNTYEIEYTADGVDCSAVLSTAGDVMEIEKGVKEAALPAAVSGALKKEFPKATFKASNLVQKFYYEVEMVIDGKTHAVKVDAAGNIDDEAKNGDEDRENAKGEKHEGKKDKKD